MSTAKEPLAYRMRPQTLNEFYGQEHIVAPGTLLYRMIKADRLSSVIFYGPPGTGKTTLARIIAGSTSANFVKLNATMSGVSDIKQIATETKNLLLNPSGRTVLFIDEIHRFNKLQQDALLPYVEDGSIILIGATTENPYFEVNKALVSRSTVFMLKKLTPEDIVKVLRNAITDEENGLGKLNINVSDEAIYFWANLCNGDARSALNALELSAITTAVSDDGSINVDLECAKECIQKKTIAFDKDGESHYDNISAFIKSMRGSDPDAAVFYLARALKGGEDPMFLARRIMICASEDVGMANPQALLVATAAAQAVHMIGMPEARILLSHAAVYVATSPKSNAAYMAIGKASHLIETQETGEVPMHLRNAPIDGMADLGYGQGYKYAHDYEGNYVDQNYLPEEVLGSIFYEPTVNGYELRIKEWLDKKRSRNMECGEINE